MDDEAKKKEERLRAEVEERLNPTPPEDFVPNEAEARLIGAAGKGAPCVLRSGEVRAAIIRILLLGLREDWPITPAGIRLSGGGNVVVSGRLDLSGARGPDGPLRPLSISGCASDLFLSLSGAQLESLFIYGCDNIRILADGAELSGNVYIANCEIAMNFSGAEVGGDVVLRKSRIRSGGPDYSIVFANARIDGAVTIEGLRSRGEAVSFSGATIAGAFSGERACLLDGDATVLNLENASIAGGVNLDNARFRGLVNFRNLRTEASVSAHETVFAGRTKAAFDASFAKIGGMVTIAQSGFRGRVLMDECRVDGPIVAAGSVFRHPRGVAVSLTAAEARLVSFDAAVVHGGLRAERGSFTEISFLGARFDRGGKLPAIDLTSTTITHEVRLGAGPSDDQYVSGAELIGAFTARDARIGGNLALTGASFTKSPMGNDCLNLHRARIGGAFELHSINGARDGCFDVSGAEMGALDDDPACWPAPGLVNLDGLTYRYVATGPASGSGETLAKSRLDWLKRQYAHGEPRKGRFSPQPFEQLARVLREQGQDYAATRVAVEKRELQRKYADRGFARFVHTILKVTSDYGYSPARALAWFAAWVLAGAGFVRHGVVTGLYERASTDQPENSHIEPFVYAFDLSTPIIDFGQASAYRIMPSCAALGPIEFCNWRELLETGYSTAGFILFSILVLTLSGVLRREA